MALAAFAAMPAPAAQAGETAPAMMLTCVGTDVATQASGSSTTVTVTPGRDPGIGSAAHRAAVVAATAGTSTSTSPTYTQVRMPARISVMIEGPAIKVRPSENTLPGFGKKKSPDGWYPLLQTAITETEFRGEAAYGSILSGKLKLAIDRQTGDAKFGSFRGVCDKAATGPAERRF